MSMPQPTPAPPPESEPAAPSFRRAGSAALWSRSFVLLATFANALLLPLVLDQANIGNYFLAVLAIAGVANLCQLGMTFLIPATVTSAFASQDFGRVRKLAAVILMLSAGMGLVVGTALAALTPWIVTAFQPSTQAAWSTALPLVAVIAPVAGLTTLVVELLRTIHAIRASARLAALSSIFPAIYAGSVLLLGSEATLRDTLLAILVGWIVSLTIGLVMIGRLVGAWRETPRAPVRAGDLIRQTLPNLYTTLILFGLYNLDLLILGTLGSLGEVAQYGLALRFAAFMLVPLAIANAAATPLAVHARTIGDTPALNHLLNTVVAAAAGAAVVLYLGFALVGHPFISLWHESYIDAYWLTLILGIGNVMHACGGAAGVLLMVWGDQRRALTITLATGTATAVLCLLGYRVGGMYGLAIASAFGNSLQVVLFTMRVRARFRLDPSLPRLWQTAASQDQGGRV